jgi:hypothetical protein
MIYIAQIKWCFEATLLVEVFGNTELIIPKAGMISTYTSGCPKNQNKC